MFSVDGEPWRILRQKLTTTFTSGKIKAMMPTLVNISHELTDVINEAVDGKQVLNYRDIAARYMCDIIGQVAFGLECEISFEFLLSANRLRLIASRQCLT